MRQLLIPLVIVAFACGGDTYRPIYYPNENDLSKYTRGPAFANIEQARQWVEDQRQQRPSYNWTYEIGKNCRPHGDTDVRSAKKQSGEPG